MAKVMPKTAANVHIWVYGRKGDAKGRFVLTRGNIEYYRKKGQNVTASCTYQELIKLFEDQIVK